MKTHLHVIRAPYSFIPSSAFSSPASALRNSSSLLQPAASIVSQAPYAIQLRVGLRDSPGAAQVCPKPGRQPATQALMGLVASDDALRESLTASIVQGQKINGDPQDTPDWQFGQTRVVLGIETPNHGVVVATPMGMAQVASIVLRDWVKEGAKVDKGWEFGNFAFGGSDFVVIFESRADFGLTVPQMASEPPGVGVNYMPSLQGQRYGCFGGDDNCSTKPELPPPYPGCTSAQSAR